MVSYDPNNIVVGVAVLFLVAYGFYIIRRMYNRRIQMLEQQNLELRNRLETMVSSPPDLRNMFGVMMGGAEGGPQMQEEEAEEVTDEVIDEVTDEVVEIVTVGETDEASTATAPVLETITEGPPVVLMEPVSAPPMVVSPPEEPTETPVVAAAAGAAPPKTPKASKAPKASKPTKAPKTSKSAQSMKVEELRKILADAGRPFKGMKKSEMQAMVLTL